MKKSDLEYNHRQLAKLDVVADEFPTINGRILVSLFAPSGRMTLRKGVVINSSVEANPVGGQQTIFIIMNDGAEIVLDEGAGMSNVTIAAATRVHIGRYAMLGAGCRIYDTDFHSIHHAERQPDNVGIRTDPVRIGDRAFIGAFAIILKGVTIGDESIVGAGAVVARSIPPGEIWEATPPSSSRSCRPTRSATYRSSSARNRR